MLLELRIIERLFHQGCKLAFQLFPFFQGVLIVYFQHYLHMDNYAIVLGVVLLFASGISVLAGRFLDKYGKLNFVLPAAGVMIVGLIGLYLVRSTVGVMVAGGVMMSGYMLVTAALSALIRDYTPKDKAGHFQGVRMVFAVALPMIIGPFIGSAVIRSGGEVYEELGVVKRVPTPAIFLATPQVLLAKTIAPASFQKQSFALRKGDEIPPQKLRFSTRSLVSPLEMCLSDRSVSF